MINTRTQSKIFLADQRGLKQNQQLQRFSTLNFESFSNPDKGAIDQLYFFNDDRLAGGQRTTFEIDIHTYIIILPITGSVNYFDDSENETDVNVEEAVVVYVEKGANITLSNPFEDQTINYLCIGLTAAEPMPNNPRFFNFDLSAQNRLIKINNNSIPFLLNIGRFDGRNEAFYRTSMLNKTFAFVITGAFEINGRLLHEKDSLVLWDTEEIDLEALSDNAIIFLIEILG